MATEKTRTEKTTAPAEVLLPVKGLPVGFDGGSTEKRWPAEIVAVSGESVEVKVTKPSGAQFVQTLPVTPGEKSAKGYRWSHA
jgi:hypothetical protein